MSNESELADNSENTLLVEIPRKNRQFKALFALLITIVGTIIVTVWSIVERGKADELTWGVLPSFIIGVCISCKFWFTTHELSEEGKKKKSAQEQMQNRTLEEFGNRWYIRYSFALLMLYVTLYVIDGDKRPNAWWGVVAGLLMVAYLAREVALVLIVIGLIYLFFQGIAALPVGVAIVVGAIIIAYAIKK